MVWRSPGSLVLILIVAGLGPAANATHASSDAEASRDVWVDPLLADSAASVAPVTVLVGLDHVPGDAIDAWLKAHAIPAIVFEHIPVVAVTVAGERVGELVKMPGALSLVRDVDLQRHGLPVDMVQPPFLWPEAVAGNFGGTGDAITRADRARALGFDGEGIGLAVIDLGTSGIHPGLRPDDQGGPLVQNVKVGVGRDRLIRSQDVESPVNLYLENQTNTDWTDGHGTHTAGIAAGTWTSDGLLGGRAPGVDLVALGTGDALALLWVVAAWDWILGHQHEYNIRIVNNSYGLEGPHRPEHPINLATKAADEAGILTFFSAGNNGPGLRTLNMLAQSPHVVAVGSTTLSGAVYTTSSRGDPQGGKPGPELVAPGADILSGRNQPVSANEITARTAWMDAGFVPPEHLPWYRAISGTSMAAPQVAGIAALVMQANESLTHHQVRDILISTTRTIPGFSYADQGHGMVDAEAAVLAALGAPVPPRDHVQPTVLSWDGQAVKYPFHGALAASPAKGFSAFEHRHPFPVHLPSEGADVRFDYRVAGARASDADQGRLALFGPDGALVAEAALQGGANGTHTITLDPVTLADHAKPGWSAAYWTLAVDWDVGLIEYDVSATVHYTDGVLPPPVREIPPTPPPLPPRVPHDPIVIASDADFTAENGVVSGSGTASDPYVIEGWDIAPATGTGVGIDIGGRLGTDAHVIVRNVRVHDSADNCVRFQSVANLVFENNLIDGCDDAVYVAAGEDLVFRSNTFAASDRGLSMYGPARVVVADNEFRDLSVSGLLVSQGLNQFGGPALEVHVRDNLFLGEGSRLLLTTPGVVGTRVQDNTFGSAASLEISGAILGVLDGSTWLQGKPHITYSVLLTSLPAVPTNTIVDAGSDVTMGPDGEACMTETLVLAAPPHEIVETTWTFGDGTTSTGSQEPCHTFPDPEATYTAELAAVVRDADGGTFVLRDTVEVG